MFSPKKHIANIITSVGILFWILACYLVITQPSWLSAEILLLWALLTDAIDGKAARKYGSTRFGPYLDDIADFINFGLHPGLWLWAITGSLSLSALYICAIFYRLIRFTMEGQNNHTYFLGLPSPAAAVAVMGIIIVYPEPLILMVSIVCIAFLSISHIPCMHIMKQGISRLGIILIILGTLSLPWLYGGDMWALWLSQCVLVLAYLLVSIIILLIPHYVMS